VVLPEHGDGADGVRLREALADGPAVDGREQCPVAVRSGSTAHFEEPVPKALDVGRGDAVQPPLAERRDQGPHAPAVPPPPALVLAGPRLVFVGDDVKGDAAPLLLAGGLGPGALRATLSLWAPTGLVVRPGSSGVVGTDRVPFHRTDPLLVDVPGTAREPDRPH